MMKLPLPIAAAWSQSDGDCPLELSPHSPPFYQRRDAAPNGAAEVRSDFGPCNAKLGVLGRMMQTHDETKRAPSTNDYYPFIVNAVSKLDMSTAESRHQACARAREELVAGLRQGSLRISESDIACECRAFDAALERVQAELARAQA
jgi:hypothetical protein